MELKSKESLKKILWKVENSKTDMSKLEKDCLKEVYEEIQEKIGKPKKLDLSCSGCPLTAIGIIKNYLRYHGGYEALERENKSEEVKAKVTIVKVDEAEARILKYGEDNTYPEIVSDLAHSYTGGQKTPIYLLTNEDIEALKKLPLKTLRAKFPEIKSTSAAGMVEKIIKMKETF